MRLFVSPLPLSAHSYAMGSAAPATRRPRGQSDSVNDNTPGMSPHLPCVLWKNHGGEIATRTCLTVVHICAEAERQRGCKGDGQTGRDTTLQSTAPDPLRAAGRC